MQYLVLLDGNRLTRLEHPMSLKERNKLEFVHNAKYEGVHRVGIFELYNFKTRRESDEKGTRKVFQTS